MYSDRIFAEIVHDPLNMTVFLNKTAVFGCEFRGNVSTWTVNSTFLNDLSQTTRNKIHISETDSTYDNSISVQLRVTATIDYNGTIFQCWAVLGDGSSDNSGIAKLEIQGII